MHHCKNSTYIPETIKVSFKNSIFYACNIILLSDKLHETRGKCDNGQGKYHTEI